MDLEQIRAQIDAIDDEFSALFVKRMQLCKEVALNKKQTGKAVLDTSREQKIINRVTLGREDLESYIASLYKTMFALSRSYQEANMQKESNVAQQIKECLEDNANKTLPTRARVAIQGVEGAYSSLACKKMFKYATVSTFKNFKDVFEAVDSGYCEYGILPIENNTAGSVGEVYELMQNYKFSIVKRTSIAINHNLMAKNKVDIANLSEIFSHEQALRQCSNYLASLKNVKITACENTAIAAKMVKESKRDDIAAICSKECADLYNLQILQSNIADSDNNHTRFICICKNLQVYSDATTSSFMVKLPHTAGSLYRLLARFDALDLNLNKLESRHIKGSDFEFLFYFDVDASIFNPNLVTIINQMEKEGVDFVYLGSYGDM